MNTLWQMDPPGLSSRDALNRGTQNLADEDILGDGPPSELSIDAMNIATPNFADEPTLANGFFKKRCEFPLISE